MKNCLAATIKWAYCWVAEIGYNFEKFFIDNILLDYKDRIYKLPVKKEEVIKISDKKIRHYESMTIVKITSYISQDHCYELLKKEYENIKEKFEIYKAEKNIEKRKNILTNIN